jgi:DNA-binding NarL/FixJ family response regulator
MSQVEHAPSARPLRVFLADDHPVVLDGIRALVTAEADLMVVGVATDGIEALQRASELQPDVAVLDLSMPGINGVEVARRLLAACPKCRILVLTVQEDGAFLRQLLALGISGYVLKRSATHELSRGIHAVAAGGLYLDPAIAGQAIGRAATPHAAADQDDGAVLSGREIEVLRLAAAGHSNKTIASKLQIGLKSVETYKARAMAKLGFQSRVDVVRFALQRGWLNDG